MLFQTQEAFDEIQVGSRNGSVLAHVSFALFGFFRQNVTLETFLMLDLAGSGHFEALLGTRIGFNLGHGTLF